MEFTLSVCVVIPAMNEQGAIKDVIKDIHAHGFEHVLVVDDASTDATAFDARNAGAIVLTHAVNLGAWRATQTGLRYALKRGFQIIVTMDADGQHLASQLPKLISTVNSGKDFVVGSCLSRGSAGRHFAWRFFKVVTGLEVRDLTSGFRAYSAKAAQILVSRQATMLEYQDVGVLMMLRQTGMQHAEIDVEMKERVNGISRIFHSWIAVLHYLLYTLVLSSTKAVPMPAIKYKRKLREGIERE